MQNIMLAHLVVGLCIASVAGFGLTIGFRLNTF
jgi:hypothetical protein